MTEYGERSDRFIAIEDRFAGYEVDDQSWRDGPQGPFAQEKG